MPRVIRPEEHLEIQTSTNLVTWSTTGVTDLSTASLLDGAISTSGGRVGFLRIRSVVGP